jgi:ABC-type ATPase involved in cell division
MLTSLELENFKGISTRQRIDFAPLTLLFGANSAGKSTILQALLYLHEVIERGSADVDRTELGGTVLELGGFARLVHRHETERAIVLRAEFATPGGLERFGRDLADFPFPDLDDDIESAWLELTIQHRTAAGFQGAMVERVAVGVNGDREPVVWIETPGSLREGEPLYCRINMGHPLIAEAAQDVADAWLSLSVPEPPWHRGVDLNFPARGPVIGLDDLLNFSDGRPLPLIAVARSRTSALPPISDPLRVILPAVESSPELTRAGEHIRTFLEMVVLGTTVQLAALLRDTPYIGPLRSIPPRGFLYQRAGRIGSWADGLAGWELLIADRLALVDRTNVWLKRLGTGCQVVVQQLFDRDADAEELSDGHVDKTVRRLLLDTGAGSLVLPSEVGAGISQVVPVIVAAVEGRFGLTLVEQPEIHVHPAVQVGLGDLFIEAVTREGSRRLVLVETHSEHLILRVLRRIRETTEKKPDVVAFRTDKLSVMYVERSPQGVRVVRLHVNEEGKFVDAWPRGFFDERFAEVYGA